MLSHPQLSLLQKERKKNRFEKKTPKTKPNQTKNLNKNHQKILFLRERAACTALLAVILGWNQTLLLIPVSPAGTADWRPGSPGAHTVKAVLTHRRSGGFNYRG